MAGGKRPVFRPADESAPFAKFGCPLHQRGFAFVRLRSGQDRMSSFLRQGTFLASIYVEPRNFPRSPLHRFRGAECLKHAPTFALETTQASQPTSVPSPAAQLSFEATPTCPR